MPLGCEFQNSWCSGLLEMLLFMALLQPDFHIIRRGALSGNSFKG